MHKRAQSGFTLIELMTTLALVAILAAIAVPNMRDFVRNNRLTSASNDLLHSLQLARTEAIKRQTNVVVCASADPNADDASIACSKGPFTGWFVFVDNSNNWDHDGAAETVLERHATVDTKVLVSNDKDGAVSFGASGFANPPGAKTPTANVVICAADRNPVQGTNSTARAILITNTGRSRVSHLTTDVSTALAFTGGTCPP